MIVLKAIYYTSSFILVLFLWELTHYLRNFPSSSEEKSWLTTFREIYNTLKKHKKIVFLSSLTIVYGNLILFNAIAEELSKTRAMIFLVMANLFLFYVMIFFSFNFRIFNFKFKVPFRKQRIS